MPSINKIHKKRYLLFVIPVIFASLLLFTGNKVLGAQNKATTVWTRTHEPVVLTGTQVPGYDGADITHIFAYAFVGGAWSQVPVQVDEVTASGVYTRENGILDGNDEIVFMAKDGGGPALPTKWIPDEGSKNTPRYEIKVINPLNPSEISYVYLYSSTLPATYGDYVDWNATENRIQSSVFELGVPITGFVGVDYLTLNGYDMDILDRSKLAGSVFCQRTPSGGGIDEPITEEMLATQGMSLAPTVDGAVRVGGGTAGGGLWAYQSYFQIKTGLNVTVIYPDQCQFGLYFDWIRFTIDLSDTLATGFSPATYYDSDYLIGVPVDGNDDPQIGTNPVDWTQISGSYGSMVQLRDMYVENGTLENYYVDDSGGVPNDTGDGQSFGDSGVYVYNPAGHLSGYVSIDMQQIILDPSLGPVGATYLGYRQNPLTVTISGQAYLDSYIVFLPLVLSSNP